MESHSVPGQKGVAAAADHSQDIPADKRADDLLRLEHSVTQCLAVAEDVPAALIEIIQAICRTERWECGRYFVVDENAQLARFEEAWGAPDPAIQDFLQKSASLTYRQGTGLIGQAWLTREPAWATDMHADTRTAQLALERGAGIRGAFVMPVLSDNKVLGLLCFSSREAREPDQRLLQAARVTGSQIGQFVHRKRVEEEQVESRRLLDNIIENIPTAVQLKSVRHDYRIVLWNKAAEAMYGISKQAAIGCNASELWPKEAADLIDAADRAQIQEGGMREFPDRPAPTKTRGTIRTYMRNVPLFDKSGRASHLLSVADDITERLSALEKLRESEARFRSLTELSSDWYWEQDENLREMLPAGVSGQHIDLRPDADQGKLRWELPISGVTDEEWADHKKRLAARHPFHDFSYQRKDASGAIRHVSISGHPVFDGQGTFRGYRGIGKDISAARRAEADLRRFRAAVDLSPDCILLADREDMRFIDVNQSACRMLGYRREELLKLGPQDLYAESREHMAAIYDAVIAGTVKGTLTGTYRRKNGSLVPIEVARRALRVDDRWVIVASVRDITSRLEADERFKQYADRQRLLAELGKAGLANTDTDALIAQAATLVSQTLAFEFCSVLQLSPVGRGLILRAAVGWPAESIGWEVMQADGGHHEAYVMAQGEPVLVSEFETESRCSRSGIAAERGIVCGIAVAIQGQDAPFGVLAVHSADRRLITEEDAAFLQGVANLLAAALLRKQSEERLLQLTQYDALTGLPNRHLFRDRLAQGITQAARNNRALAVIYINLDRFKHVNDTHGRAAGDALLVEAAMRMGSCVRSGDTVGRFEGDEFGIILSGMAKVEDAALVAQKIVAVLARPFTLNGEEGFVSASAGISLYPTDGDSPDGLLGNADIAMHRAKQQGNAYQFYTAQMNQRTEGRSRLEGQLRHALERGEFSLLYHPKVELGTGRIGGAEALLRWTHPQLGVVSPAEFIPLLEETRLILPVGQWVLRTACEQVRAWQQAGLAVPGMAVNLSTHQFQQQDLVEQVRQTIAAAGIDPKIIEFEITESMLARDPEQAAKVLHALKGLGVSLSIDDFGTGYSSLAHLKRFPLDALKIDRAFVQEVTTNPNDAAIATAIINLAHNLGLKVVAEGVETEGQLNFLVQHGCDQMQGFLFARPTGAPSFAVMLGEGKQLQIRAAGGTAKAKLLILDDREEELVLLKRTLGREGYNIVTALKAADAFEILATSKVDIVISDQKMPGMPGVEFLAKVRELYPWIIRIVATGSEDARDIADAINDAAIHKFISKSWDKARICETLRQVTKQTTADKQRGAASKSDTVKKEP